MRRLSLDHSALFAYVGSIEIEPGRTEMTIYEALKAKLGREPSTAEMRTDCLRIIDAARVEAAEKGRLPHQRRR
jgi:hypothetical protein